jgi:hypothetical protein
MQANLQWPSNIKRLGQVLVFLCNRQYYLVFLALDPIAINAAPMDSQAAKIDALPKAIATILLTIKIAPKRVYKLLVFVLNLHRIRLI